MRVNHVGRLSLLVLLGLFACKPEGPTQVVLRVRTREDVAPKLARLYVRIATPDGQTWREQKALPIDLDGLTWPIDLPVLPGSGKPDDGTFEAIIEGQGADGTRIVETRVITNFVPHHEKLLVMMLAPCGTSAPDDMCLAPDDCHGEACPACHYATGQCGGTPVVAGESLPELEPDAKAGAGVLTVEADPHTGVDAATPPDELEPADGSEDGSIHLDAGPEANDGGTTLKDPIDGGDLSDASMVPDDGGDGSDGGLPPSQRCPTSERRPSQPFGIRTVPYVAGLAEPFDFVQGELDLGTTNQYDRWKAAYVRETGCGDGMVFVQSDAAVPKATTSEAHGYAMLIMVYMAGHDSDARRLFDGMVRYYLAHSSEESEYLMAKQQGSACANVGAVGTNSEADMDIALALLLANKQWGSGETDYYGHAYHMLGAILEHDADQSTMLSGSRPSRPDTTPTSAFAPAHFASFATVRDAKRWDELRADGYALLTRVVERHSPVVKLWPDFIAEVSSAAPRPATSLEVEGDHDGAFSHRASRGALRMALHRVTTLDPTAKRLLEGASGYIMSMSDECDPLTLKSSYNLKGMPVVDGFRMPFTAPQGPAAMVQGDTEWVTGLWNVVGSTYDSEGTYYSDTIQLLATLIMSRNAWLPESVACPVPPIETAPPTLVLSPGAEGKDARVYSLMSQRNTAGGNHDRFAAMTWSWSSEEASYRSLIDFDLSAVPANATLTKATLKLFVELTPGTNQKGHSQLWGTNEAYLRRITSPWEEDSVTWNTQPSTSVVDQIQLPKSRYNSEDYEIDVTDFVKEKLASPSGNFGFALQLKTEERYRTLHFASSDHKDEALHPRLELVYHVPAP